MFPRVYQEEEGVAVLYNRRIQTFWQKNNEKLCACGDMHVLYVDVVCVGESLCSFRYVVPLCTYQRVYSMCADTLVYARVCEHAERA